MSYWTRLAALFVAYVILSFGLFGAIVETGDRFRIVVGGLSLGALVCTTLVVLWRSRYE